MNVLSRNDMPNDSTYENTNPYSMDPTICHHSNNRLIITTTKNKNRLSILPHNDCISKKKKKKKKKTARRKYIRISTYLHQGEECKCKWLFRFVLSIFPVSFIKCRVQS